MRLRRNAGLTLLEVVVAVSLLSLLMAGVMTALRLGLNALSKTNTRLMANRRVAGAQQILQEQLEGFMPVLAAYGSTPDAPSGAKAPFFQGEPETMRFVSTFSLQEAARGRPRILEFQVIPGEGGHGVRLVVNEHLYSGPISAGLFMLGPNVFPPIAIGPASFVLADRLASCKFAYQQPEGAWVPLWTEPKWPAAIRIEMGPLDEDITRLRPVSVVAQMHVTRIPMPPWDYNDRQ